MEKAHFSAELMKHISEMDCDHPVVQYSVLDKGRFLRLYLKKKLNTPLQ